MYSLLFGLEGFAAMISVREVSNRTLAAFFALLFITLSGSAAAAVQDRIALVVGNSNYPVGRLKNAVNDSQLMARTLEAKGFKVTSLQNATQRQLEGAIRKFASELTEQSVGLFYYAGHGIELDGNNFLIPVDAEIYSEVDVEYEGVHAGRLLDSLKRANSGLNLVILDACRNNPYASSFRSASRGLSRMQPSSGSLILYATEPGSVASDGNGQNGLFTEHLVNAINQPNYSIEKVFKETAKNVSRVTSKKQIPYIEGVVLGEFYFSGGAPATANSATQAAVGQSDSGNSGEHERAFWAAVQGDPTAEMYEAYLSQYPNGHYVALAEIKLRKLGNSTNQVVLLQSATTTTQPSVATNAVSQLQEMSVDSISGKYYDNYFNSVSIRQNGTKISGYIGNNGELKGEIEGNTIRFSFNFTGYGGSRLNFIRTGEGILTISDNGSTISGNWDEGKHSWVLIKEGNLSE
ncbi:MAG: putative caspase-like protein [Planctomycetota bacterium]